MEILTLFLLNKIPPPLLHHKKIFTLLAALVITGLHLSAQTYYTVVNQVIPDNGSVVTFDLAVSGLPDAIDTTFGLESVCFNITHTWDSDLQLKLISPDGTTVLLISGVGGDGDNFIYTCLNDFSPNPVSAGTAPFTGMYAAMGDLGLINNGQNPNGTWKLQCNDTYPQDEGTLHNFQITFGDNPALPFIFTESNLPLILINTNGQEIFSEPKVAADIKIIDHGNGILNHPTDTDYAYVGKIMMELQGFTGPYYPKKNYDFDLVDDDSLEIDTVLLALPSENDFILKAEYLDLSLMKNTITYEMSRRMGRYAPRTMFCEVMLNGEYIGVYTLTEKIKRDENRVDIADLKPEDIAGDELTGGYIIEINENGYPNDWNSLYLPINYATCQLPVAYKMVEPQIEDIQPQQFDYIHAYVDSFENALHGNLFLDSVNGYRKFISVKSFIDFMIVNEFSANYDSYGRSTFLYKEKISDGGQLHIGPPWDYDRAFAPGTEQGWVWEITHPYWPFPFWWSKFREDPEWVNEVYCRYTSLREEIMKDESFFEIIDSLQNLLEQPAERNFKKWAELGVTSPPYFVEELKNFIASRFEWLDDAVAADYIAAPDATFTTDQVAAASFIFTPVLSGADYNWNFGDGTFSSEQIPLHVFDNAGSYTVSLTVDQYYGCSATYDTTLDVVVITGADQSADRYFKTYPSPFSNLLHIQLPVSNEEFEMSLINNLGVIVMKQKISRTQLFTLHTGHLPAGIYRVKLFDGEKNYFETVIKQ
ncbi:MAG: CotH kinase family protein [Chitinophagales bacterium]|nr:CotH kinase family protein [Chitinophagales bacterium]